VGSFLRTFIGYSWAMASLVVFLPIGLLSMPFDPRQRVHDRLSIIWARGILFFAGVRLRIEGREHVRRDAHYVIVANHQSLLDAMIMVATMQPLTAMRMVAKRTLFKVPVLGWAMRAFGHMAVDHRSMRGSLDGLKKAQSTVQRAQSTVFFPEGTRSPDGKMLPFHTAAFHIAARAGAKVLPVTISGSREILPKQRLVLVKTGDVSVRIHPPMDALGTALDEVKKTSDAAREIIERSLDAADRRPAGPAPAAG
jgi:1-acyl-sn-glycerol-3-phosphate acyltransferase